MGRTGAAILLITGLATALAAPKPARAQDSSQVGELVVTGERRAYEPPHAVVFRRADNLAVEVEVDCDTRDQAQRLEEMKSTLRNMLATAAANGQIELGIEANDVVVPLKAEALDTILSPGKREDTTTTTIVVKTHVTEADSFEGASARVDQFILKTKVVGRAQVSRTGDWQLTLVTPRQYRPQVIAAIAQDANDTLKAFGGGYGVEIEGLEHPVEWSRAGPLDLALFIPYSLKIEPLPAR
jgi:hypothetical protein